MTLSGIDCIWGQGSHTEVARPSTRSPRDYTHSAVRPSRSSWVTRTTASNRQDPTTAQRSTSIARTCSSPSSRPSRALPVSHLTGIFAP